MSLLTVGPRFMCDECGQYGEWRLDGRQLCTDHLFEAIYALRHAWGVANTPPFVPPWEARA